MRPGSLLRCSPLSGAKILKTENDSKQAFCAKWIALKCGTNEFCCFFKNIFWCLEEIILIKIINFSLFQKWHKRVTQPTFLLIINFKFSCGKTFTKWPENGDFMGERELNVGGETSLEIWGIIEFPRKHTKSLLSALKMSASCVA